MSIVIAAVASTLVVMAVGAWLFPRGPKGPGGVDTAGLAWREYEDAKRRGCTL